MAIIGKARQVSEMANGSIPSVSAVANNAASAVNNRLDTLHEHITAPPNVNPHVTTDPQTPERASTTTSSSTNDKLKVLDHTTPNALEKFASYSPLWSMACLSPTQFNNPSSYRNLPNLSNIILSSAGRYDAERVQTAYGAPEYFITELKQTVIVAPNAKIGNTYASNYEIEIFEPYSMGLFLQSVQLASIKAKYDNHLSAPFVIKLEFKGFDDSGRPLLSGVPPKYFVFKINRIEFTVTESGSKYSIQAVPYNQSAYSDTSIKILKDVTMTALNDHTVEEMLSTGKKSLEVALNNIEKERVAQKNVDVPNEYVIEFPVFTTASNTWDSHSSRDSNAKATVNPDEKKGNSVTSQNNQSSTKSASTNKIGKAEFGFTVEHGGAYEFANEDFKHTTDGEYQVGELSINPEARTFHFAQGQTIISIINEVIKNSKYIPKAMKDKPTGFIDYFKIDVEIEILGEDKRRGERAKKITFKVVPYGVHESININPLSTPKGYDIIKNAVAKEYNYIYTGQNIDVLNFEIKINNLYFVAKSPSSENLNPSTVNQDLSGIAETIEDAAEVVLGSKDDAAKTNLGRAKVQADPSLSTNASSGFGADSIEKQIADSFHRMFIEGASADLVNLELKIIGDPHWISDSGMANHSIASPFPQQTNGEGAMNYEAGDIFIYITFRNPNDVLEKQGLYSFTDGPADSAFSGIYRVTLCENLFENGLFTQTLKGVRMIGQDYDFVDSESSAGAKGETASVKTDKILPSRSRITDGPSS